jgi:hypothetical protein
MSDIEIILETHYVAEKTLPPALPQPVLEPKTFEKVNLSASYPSNAISATILPSTGIPTTADECTQSK